MPPVPEQDHKPTGLFATVTTDRHIGRLKCVASDKACTKSEYWQLPINLWQVKGPLLCQMRGAFKEMNLW